MVHCRTVAMRIACRASCMDMSLERRKMTVDTMKSNVLHHGSAGPETSKAARGLMRNAHGRSKGEERGHVERHGGSDTIRGYPSTSMAQRAFRCSPSSYAMTAGPMRTETSIP